MTEIFKILSEVLKATGREAANIKTKGFYCHDCGRSINQTDRRAMMHGLKRCGGKFPKKN